MLGSENKAVWTIQGKRFPKISATVNINERMFLRKIYKELGTLAKRKRNAVFLALSQAFDIGLVTKNDKNTQDNGHHLHGKGSIKSHH